MTNQTASFAEPYHYSWRDPAKWHHWNYDSIWIALFGGYLILFCAAIFTFLTKHYKYAWYLFPAFFSTIIFRLLLFIYNIFVQEDIIAIPSAFSFLIQTFPSYLFFSCFMVVLASWSELYIGGDEERHYSKKRLRQRLKLFLRCCNIGIYAILLVLNTANIYLSLSHKEHEDSYKRQWAKTAIERSMMLLLAILYIIIPIGFVVTLYVIYYRSFQSNLLHRHKHNPESKKLLRKITITTLVCIVSFMLRAAMVIYTDFDSSLQQIPWINGVYFSAFELFPLSLILITYVGAKSAVARLPSSVSIHNLYRESNNRGSSNEHISSPLTITSPLLMSYDRNSYTSINSSLGTI